MSLLLFGLVGLAANVACLLVGWIPPVRKRERVFRIAIHRLFRLFLWWTRVTRLCLVEYRGVSQGAAGGTILVANHPSLMDAVYLLAVVPNAICIFKPAIRRNPVLGAAARRAGYLSSEAGLDLIREAADKVANGASLIVFPEGTRTPIGVDLGPVRPGFAAIAQRARAPLQLVHVAASTNVLARGWRWWQVPDLPGKTVIEFGPRLLPRAGASAHELVHTAVSWFETRSPVRFDGDNFVPNVPMPRLAGA